MKRTIDEERLNEALRVLKDMVMASPLYPNPLKFHRTLMTSIEVLELYKEEINVDLPINN